VAGLTRGLTGYFGSMRQLPAHCPPMSVPEGKTRSTHGLLGGRLFYRALNDFSRNLDYDLGSSIEVGGQRQASVDRSDAFSHADDSKALWERFRVEPLSGIFNGHGVSIAFLQESENGRACTAMLERVRQSFLGYTVETKSDVFRDGFQVVVQHHFDLKAGPRDFPAEAPQSWC
jgi:hypothetical protein